MIQVSGLSKSFRVSKRGAGFKEAAAALFKRDYEIINALSDISFTINQGEMMGYVGPNGAGKSTTIKIMCGILTPDSGKCTVGGIVPYERRKEHVKNIGVVFGQRSQLWWDVPVIDSFELLKDIYQIDNSVYSKNLNELTELLNLSEIIKTPARNLSLGQRMRCEIAASLLHEPKVLFLDEPTIGLDAVSKIAVREFIKRINKEHKTTVILTTHDMQDIEALASRIILIGRGQIILDGSMEEIGQKFSGKKNIVVEYSGEISDEIHGLKIVGGAHGRREYELHTDILSVSRVVSYLSSHVDIKDISIKGITAEEMIVEMYKEYKI